jgi:hypothetical protein
MLLIDALDRQTRALGKVEQVVRALASLDVTSSEVISALATLGLSPTSCRDCADVAAMAPFAASPKGQPLTVTLDHAIAIGNEVLTPKDLNTWSATGYQILQMIGRVKNSTWEEVSGSVDGGDILFNACHHFEQIRPNTWHCKASEIRDFLNSSLELLFARDTLPPGLTEDLLGDPEYMRSYTAELFATVADVKQLQHEAVRHALAKAVDALENLCSPDTTIERSVTRAAGVAASIRVLRSMMTVNAQTRKTLDTICLEDGLVGAKMLPQMPNALMIEEGAQALVRWEDDSVWPDSWGSDADRIRREAMKVYAAMFVAYRADAADGEVDPSPASADQSRYSV